MAGIKRNQLVNMNQHYKRYSLDYFLDCQQRAGFENIEFWLGASHFYIDSKEFENPAPVIRKFRDRGLKVVSVTTPSMAYQYQYASQEKELLEQSYRYFTNGVRVASEFGADRIVINSGWGYNGENYDEMWKRLREHIYRVCDFAAECGIICAMESLRDDESNIVYTLKQAEKMFHDVNHPNLKMMVDNIATDLAGESLEEWFEAFGDDLVHMHFLDGNPPAHSSWGDGNTPLLRELETMERHNYKGYLVQEVADDKYFSDPFKADIRNMRVLERFIEDK